MCQVKSNAGSIATIALGALVHIMLASADMAAPVLTEKEARDSVAAVVTAFNRPAVAYDAEVSIDYFAVYKGVGHDPSGRPIVVLNQFDKAKQLIGTVEYKRSDIRELISMHVQNVEAEVIRYVSVPHDTTLAADGSMMRAQDKTTGRVSGWTRPRTNPDRVGDICIPTVALMGELGDDWLSLYTGVTADRFQIDLDKATKSTVINVVKGNASADDRWIITDKGVIPSISDAFGELSASRSVTFSSINGELLPTSLDRSVSGELERRYLLDWKSVKPVKGQKQAVSFPVKIVIERYVPRQRKPGTDLILTSRQTVTYKPDSLILSDNADDVNFVLPSFKN